MSAGDERDGSDAARDTPSATHGSADGPAADIAALFAAEGERRKVPSALDARVLAAARAAVSADAGSERAANDGERATRKIDRGRAAPEVGPSGRARRAPTVARADGRGRPRGAFGLPAAAPRWLAAAAVLALAVAIVPIVSRQAPEPASDEAPSSPPGRVAAEPPSGAEHAPEAVAESDDPPETRAAGRSRSDAVPPAEPVATPLAESTPATAPVRSLPRGAAASRLADADVRADTAVAETPEEESGPVDAGGTARVRPAEVGTDAEASVADDGNREIAGVAAVGSGEATTRAERAKRAPSSAAFAPAAPVSDEGADAGGDDATEPAHRRTPERWLAHLRERLREEGVTRALREEYARFRERHPRFAPGFDLPAEEGSPSR